MNFGKIKIIINSLIGYFIKLKIDLLGFNCNTSKKSNVVVSLTSYGRRVESVVYYTLVSILQQSIRPNKIILWLDNAWSLENLPNKIKQLMEYGVEIDFCEDIKSYKKLIPTLKKYPNDIIITIDDDMIYSKHLVKSLIDGYNKDGNIQCSVASIPQRQGNEFIPYNMWKPVKSIVKSDISIIPIGVGGVLYPPKSLNSEVVNVNEFMTLAPNADDLWFWVMAKRNGSNHSFIKLKGQNYSFDAFYQFFHKGSALTHSNSKECQNDIQLKQIIHKYPIEK